jgi:3-deoxy-D-manno-octulosonate 8-phosphate phosphatase (KDO 8-P phosphatase)
MGMSFDLSNAGEFIEKKALITNKLQSIKALIFDWDGVFHSGYKKSNKESSFSEADSMGINMLRFSYYLANKTIPYTAIITGENNETATYFAQREHFDHVFLKSKNKVEILDTLRNNVGISKDEILFVFDDILDLSLARVCGLRFMVKREASFILKQFCLKNKFCDYITQHDAGNHAIREICEVAMALSGSFTEVIKKRINFDEDYLKYIKKRKLSF